MREISRDSFRVHFKFQLFTKKLYKAISKIDQSAGRLILKSID